MRENFSNDAQDTLNGGINDSVTTLTVHDGSEFPAMGFRLKIGNELLLCTSRASNTLTVVRGVEGSTADSHSDSAVVTHVLTAGALVRTGRDNVPLWGSSAPVLNSLTSGGSLLTAASFSWTNQGGATLTDHNGTVTLRAPRSASTDWRLVHVAAPSPPYTVIAAFSLLLVRDLTGSSGNPIAGLILRNSGSGTFHDLSFNTNSTTPFRFGSNDWTDETTFAGLSRVVVTNPLYMQSVHWMKVTDDGTDLTYSISPDGIEWITLLQHGRTALGAPDQIGFGMSNQQSGSGNFDGLLRLLHFSVE